MRLEPFLISVPRHHTPQRDTVHAGFAGDHGASALGAHALGRRPAKPWCLPFHIRTPPKSAAQTGHVAPEGMSAGLGRAPVCCTGAGRGCHALCSVGLPHENDICACDSHACDPKSWHARMYPLCKSIRRARRRGCTARHGCAVGVAPCCAVSLCRVNCTGEHHQQSGS